LNKSNFGISVILSSILCTCVDAQIMDIGTNFYRDYLDFAQNKGVFKPQDNPLTFVQRNGSNLVFNKIPDNSARNNKGNYTSLGRNFVVTATHVEERSNATDYNEKRGWFGNTMYEYLTRHSATPTSKIYNTETTYLRTNKYIVEGNIDPIDIPGLDLSPASRDDQDAAEAEVRKVEDYFKEIKNRGGANGNNIFAYQAGTGLLSLEKPRIDPVSGHRTGGYDTVIDKDDTDNQTLGGSLNDISVFNSATYKKRLPLLGQDHNLNGIYILASTNENFRNKLYIGDSGSGFFVYDTVKKKWVLVGVTSVASGEQNYASIVSARDFSDYKQAYENVVSGTNITDTELVANKDNILDNTNGSTITLNNDLNLGHGGIALNSGDMTLDTSNGSKIVKFAGFDIADGANLNLNAVSETSVHKIGKGSLVVNSSGNKVLRLGQGTVELKALNAFESIYLTSGRGLLKLGINENLSGKLFFGNGGGTLDLNGFNQAFHNISANANSAKIINSSTQRSTLTINGDSGKDTIVHASIDKNIDIKHSGQGKELAFDGGFDIDGSLMLENAKVTLQGHPRTHAIGDASILTQSAKDKITSAGLSEPSYMDLTRPSTLAQPDWEERNFNAREGIKLDSSELTIGKDAKVDSSITAKNSTINLSGNLAHYIDKFDGSNTYDDGLRYRQNIERGNLLVKDVSFKNKIVMDSDSMLRVGGTTTKVKELAINGKILAPTRDVVSGSGTLEVENLEVSGGHKMTIEPDSKVTKNLKIRNFSNENDPILDFKKVLTLGAGMRFDIDFETVLKDGMTPDKTYTLLSAQKIINNGAIFNNNQKIGDLFMTYAITDGKLTMKLSDKKGVNPALSPEAEQNNGVSSLGGRESRILNIIKSMPEYASADRETISRAVQKVDSDMREISDGSLKVSMRALENSNEMINSRLWHLTQLRATTDISQFKLAGLESDIMPSAMMAYEAAEAQRQRNNFWFNVNGGYFRDKESSGNTKLYGTNIGYDRSYDEFILGVSSGIGVAKFSGDNLKDSSKIYSFGTYGLFERDAHEIQGNLNFAFLNSKRNMSDSQKANVNGRGILSSTYYKYAIPVETSSVHSQSIKPVVALELSYNNIDGFKSNRYNQKDIDNFSASIGLGIEYVISSEQNAFTAQFLVKQNIYNSGNKSYVSFNNSNEYIDYQIDNNKLSYKLNLTADTKLDEKLSLSYQISTMVDNDKNYGISGGLKLEYKF